MAVLNFDIKSVSLPSGEEAKAVFLSGSIDASTNQQFEGRLSDILSAGTNKVLLVLTNVKYINSTGLGTIVKCVDTFRDSQGDIKLVGVPTKVIALFEMLGLLALFETYETIEEAVNSFAQETTDGGNDDAATPSESAASFPIQFKHPVSGMGLNISGPGRFRDPRSGDYFSVDSAGKIEFYQTSKVKIVDTKVPCDGSFSSGLMALATALAGQLHLKEDVSAAIERSIDEACSLIAKNNPGSSDNCHVLMVGDGVTFKIGFVSHGNGLNTNDNDPCMLAIRGSMDEVTHKVLPNNGYLLSMSKAC